VHSENSIRSTTLGPRKQNKKKRGRVEGREWGRRVRPEKDRTREQSNWLLVSHRKEQSTKKRCGRKREGSACPEGKNESWAERKAGTLSKWGETPGGVEGGLSWESRAARQRSGVAIRGSSGKPTMVKKKNPGVRAKKGSHNEARRRGN